MYFDPYEAICMQTSHRVILIGHNVPSVSFPHVSFKKKKLYWITSLPHIAAVAVFEAEEMRRGNHKLIVKQQLRVHGL